MTSFFLRRWFVVWMFVFGVVPTEIVLANNTGKAEAGALQVLKEQASQLEHYAKARLLEEQARHDVLYLLPLSKPQKVNGRWRHEQQKALQVTIFQQTFELDAEVGLNTLKRYYEEAIATRDKEVLFRCEGLACGSSNQWANGVFAKKVLYGPDRQQWYQVSVLSRSVLKAQPLELYLQAYLIQRGNRKVYLHLVWLAEFATDVPTAGVSQYEGATQWVARITLKELQGAEQLTALIKQLKTMQSNEKGVWLLAGYQPYSKRWSKMVREQGLATTQNALQEHSLQHALELRRLLLQQSVFKANTVFTYGVGDWAQPTSNEPRVDVYWRSLP